MEINVVASGSRGNCYIISDGKCKLMLDCGIPYPDIQEACGFNLVDEISGVLVTHEHSDHIKAAKHLMKNAVNVYASQGTFDAAHLSGHRAKVLMSLHPTHIGTFTVLPFEVEHDAEEPLGFLIYSEATKERLLYFTDTYYLKYQFRQLNYIMGECNFSTEIAEEHIRKGHMRPELLARLHKSHMTLEHFLDFLKANDMSGVRLIYLLHLSDANSNEAAFISKVKEIVPNADVKAFGN